jgi:hypothetical protein
MPVRCVPLDVINGGTSAQPVYKTTLCAACPYISDLCSNTLAFLLSEGISMHTMESVDVAVMCVMKLLVCRLS